MNEDEHGITPANVTSMTMEIRGRGWFVTIEQGNGDVIKTIELTAMERMQLAMMLGMDAMTGTTRVAFVDIYRVPTQT
jgi:hypothetical protein